MKRRALIIQRFITERGATWEVRRPSIGLCVQSPWLVVALIKFLYLDLERTREAR